jgi:[phosphatase 2A protein]-leucine-carboxy methyltransferase
MASSILYVDSIRTSVVDARSCFFPVREASARAPCMRSKSQSETDIQISTRAQYLSDQSLNGTSSKILTRRPLHNRQWSSPKHLTKSNSMTDTSFDNPIMATADDALSAKQATVQAGYYEDPFITAFPEKTGGRPRHHVQPIIKRGTHARVSVMDRAIASFLELNSRLVTDKSDDPVVQVVVLGAGKDTSFFRYQTGRLGSTGGKAVRWFEVDHEAVQVEKVALISSLLEVFNTRISKTGNGWRLQAPQSTNTTSDCFMVSHDLREDPHTLFDKLKQNDLDPDTPTLFVMECVQMYLPEDSGRLLLQAVVKACPNACLCYYEPALQSDPFGKVMEQNLTNAQVVLPDSCLIKIGTLQQHLQRLVAAGFHQAVGCDMWAAYNTVVTEEQRKIANRCEFLDEVEEWILIMRHYCVIVACTPASTIQTYYCQVGKQSPMGFVAGQSETIIAD